MRSGVKEKEKGAATSRSNVPLAAVVYRGLPRLTAVAQNDPTDCLVMICDTWYIARKTSKYWSVVKWGSPGHDGLRYEIGLMTWMIWGHKIYDLGPMYFRRLRYRDFLPSFFNHFLVIFPLTIG